MNAISKITIPVEKIYQAINDPQVLHAQSLIHAHKDETVYNQETYNQMAYTIKLVNDVIKYIESSRKQVTAPLDLYKKEVMKIEQETIDPMLQFIQTTKAKMLEYHNVQERIKREAEAKIKAEAEASLKQAQSVSDIMASFTDQLFATSVDIPKTANIRTTIKAQINGEVQWGAVLAVLFQSGKLAPEDLLKNLPAAMKVCGVDAISGIELIEVKTQSIR
jgi:hypothetical protein